MQANEKGFLLCPICKRKTNTRVLSETTLRRFPLYCSRCKAEVIIDYQTTEKKEPRAGYARA